VTAFAILGLGEAGGTIAADLEAAGAAVRGYDPRVPGRAGSVREAVADCDVVLSFTSAAAALAAASDALPALGAETVFADANTAAPALKRELAAALGGRFADVALLGPVPARGIATPALASGPAAQRLAGAMAPFGMPVRVVSDRPGDAAALKLVRSVFMKGLAAAVLESAAAADALGDRAWLEEQVAAVIGEPMLRRLVEGSRAHAARRVDEMDAACDLLRELGVEPRVASASRDVLGDLE
jgi:3-hydroxyisobutyrate dehydrogenase-like beta-hydroxyacid dehydrogenase